MPTVTSRDNTIASGVSIHRTNPSRLRLYFLSTCWSSNSNFDRSNCNFPISSCSTFVVPVWSGHARSFSSSSACSCSFAAISCCKDCSPAFNCDCCSAHASATCVGVYVDNACFPVSSCKLANMPSAYFFFAICTCSVCFWSNVCRHLPNAFSLFNSCNSS